MVGQCFAPYCIYLKMHFRLSATAWIHDSGENLDAEGLQLVERLNKRMEKLTGLTSSTAEAYQGKASNNSQQRFAVFD